MRFGFTSRWAWLCVLTLVAISPCFLKAGEAAPDAPLEHAPEQFASAKLVMLTYMEAITSGESARLPEAVACFDLSQVEAVDRPVFGPRRARQLLDILDRTWKVDYEEIESEPGAELWRKPLTRDGKTFGTLVISRQTDGSWRFDASFVAQIPDIWKQVAPLPTLESFKGADQDLAMRIRRLVPERLQRVGFLLEHWQWLGLLALILSGVVLDKALVVLGCGLARRLVKEEETGVNEELRALAVRPLGVIAMAALFWFGVYWLDLPPKVNGILATVAVFFMAFALVQGLYRLVDVVCAYLLKAAQRTESKMDDLLVPLIRKTLKIFVVVFGVVFVAGQLGIDVTSMLLGLGIGGVAFAFAAKDTVENFFGSVTVLLDRPFMIGDWVVVEGVEGTVEEVGFRSTRIRTFYNSLVTVPNAAFIRAKVDNYGKRFKRRIKCFVSVTYDTPPAKIEAFCEGIRELVLQHPYTAKDYYHVYLNQFAASSLDILLYVFVKTPDWATELRERERLLLDIVRLAKHLGVEFAFPTQTLHVGSLPEAGKAWPREPVEADRATERDEVVRLGRTEAAELAKKHFGADGALPQPVQFVYDPNNPHARAGSAE